MVHTWLLNQNPPLIYTVTCTVTFVYDSCNVAWCFVKSDCKEVLIITDICNRVYQKLYVVVGYKYSSRSYIKQ